MSANQHRRDFLKKTTAASVGLGLLGSHGYKAFSTPASDKLVVGIMGVNSRGSALATGFTKTPGIEVAYICDVDDAALAKGLKAVEDAGQKKAPKAVKDFRKVLDDKGVDALVIAAPDHWHAPASLLALSAGKNVYVEKPGSHNPYEGEMVASASLKYGKVVKMGNQRRSWPFVAEALRELKKGVIGNVYLAKGWYANTRASIGYGKVAPVPSGLDYDMWQGPAPRMPYKDNLIHYNWHWFWHWGTGELLNNGTHFVDLCRLGLGVEFPTKVSSLGGRYAYKDDWQTPDTQMTLWDFAGNKTISWEGRSCNGHKLEGESAGVSFHGENGTLVIDGNSYVVYDNQDKLVKRASAETTGKPLDATGPGFDLDADHIADFYKSIKEGKTPVSDYKDSRKSVLLCHLGNISQRVGRSLNCNPENGNVIGDNEAMALWKRSYEPGWEPKV
jgi:predicted dehydrogenase